MTYLLCYFYPLQPFSKEAEALQKMTRKRIRKQISLLPHFYQNTKITFEINPLPTQLQCQWQLCQIWGSCHFHFLPLTPNFIKLPRCCQCKVSSMLAPSWVLRENVMDDMGTAFDLASIINMPNFSIEALKFLNPSL